jgi:hypothetical protein
MDPERTLLWFESRHPQKAHVLGAWLSAFGKSLDPEVSDLINVLILKWLHNIMALLKSGET